MRANLLLLAAAAGLLTVPVAPATAQHPVVPRPRTAVVASVLDGDTVRLETGQDVRLVGIDAPDHGDCGFEAAQARLVRLVQDRTVKLVAPIENKDQYDRLLRYVQVGKKDIGLKMIRAGLAVARYDSRDGYSKHPREKLYHRVDDASPDVACR
jgi:endonuclease YncB( thermonuclease family)